MNIIQNKKTEYRIQRIQGLYVMDGPQNTLQEGQRPCIGIAVHRSNVRGFISLAVQHLSQDIPRKEQSPCRRTEGNAHFQCKMSR